MSSGCISMVGMIRALCIALLASAAPAAELAPKYQEGEDYVALPIPVETRDPAKIEVVEVFSYACIHCYTLEPVLEAWQRTLADDVDFHRLPLVSQRLRPFAHAFFAAKALDVLEQVHLPIFVAIHEHGIDMTRPQYIRRLFEREAGVSEEDFSNVFDSFGVHSRVNQADGQARTYRIMATPTLVINGRYVVEVPPGGGTAMLLIADYLIEKERAAAD